MLSFLNQFYDQSVTGWAALTTWDKRNYFTQKRTRNCRFNTLDHFLFCQVIKAGDEGAKAKKKYVRCKKKINVSPDLLRLGTVRLD